MRQLIKIPRIYIDTSVIGGCFDDEFHVWSNSLIDNVKTGVFKSVTSEIVAAEIADAPEYVQAKYRELISFGIEKVSESEQSLTLLAEYKNREILSNKFSNDMSHIALATVAEVDIVVSWNFKHIVNYGKINLFNSVNLACGYRTLGIYSPMEVSSYEKEI
jgi:hypothetical protein